MRGPGSDPPHRSIVRNCRTPYGITVRNCLSICPGICWMALEFDLNRDAPAAAHTDCIVVGAFADNSLTPAAKALDEASNGRIRALLERGDASGKTGKTALLHDLPGVSAPRVLVIGLGDAGKFGVPQYLKAAGDAARALNIGPVST